MWSVILLTVIPSFRLEFNSKWLILSHWLCPSLLRIKSDLWRCYLKKLRSTSLVRLSQVHFRGLPPRSSQRDIHLIKVQPFSPGPICNELADLTRLHCRSWIVRLINFIQIAAPSPALVPDEKLAVTKLFTAGWGSSVRRRISFQKGDQLSPDGTVRNWDP